ncbi:hypothetical protein J2X46_001285 [Nocardioides sp. BE266]|uniref:hypothetical protein n=1 Tax=Nocardioides sp. BE266 TaxID=2817725 RepID=UPI0028674D0B|nr:hypothetical protein [Nocardioides sp. BE266]MDR7252309.1 hypothetical protein [Nocardioides sp. BE266]
MRISVECGGLASAADACRTANQTAALLTESLSGKLAGFGGMAGNDASSADFARSYDAAAAEAIASLAGLTHSFIGLGRLLSATGANHEAAEAQASGRVAAYSGSSLADSFVRVAPPSQPSSLGAQEPSFGVVDRWILDQVEGFVWPGADVELLREAAHAWTRAAASVAALADHVDIAEGLVEHQRSPEIPAALASLVEVRTLVADTAAELMALGMACEDYAAAVEDVHARTRVLLSEIAKMVVEGAVISAVVGGLTGGLGGSATAAAAAARVRAQAPRFHALLVGLRATIATGSARLRSARDALRSLRARFDRFAKVAVRDERGSMRNPGGWWGPRYTRVRRTIDDPELFDPEDLRGMNPAELRRMLDHWGVEPSRTGDGLRFIDPNISNRRIRIMNGYAGNRPDRLTHGPYVVVSQNYERFKIPLEGNPLL